jgi:alkyldihydroxyacetonephosphate synthase
MPTRSPFGWPGLRTEASGTLAERIASFAVDEPLPPAARALQPLPPARLSVADAFAGSGAGRVATSEVERRRASAGASTRDALRMGASAGAVSGFADAVVYPASEEEVVAALKVATRERIALVPYGGGTSVTDSTA